MWTSKDLKSVYVCELVSGKGKGDEKREEVRLVPCRYFRIRLNRFKEEAVWIEWRARGLTLPMKPRAP